ncbi:hypothetical protein L3i20_v206680 [Paenibacillus sp. L3-i20]|nr:hypothetical protein L3i20_v206680 [Paenibacillus sp. L3-i20]
MDEALENEQRNDYDEQLHMLKNAILLDPTNKQIRTEYLEALQKSYTFYQIVLAPTTILKRLKPWQILIGWFANFLLAKPFLIVFVVLYILTHWVTKLLVHLKVFGWTFKR